MKIDIWYFSKISRENWNLIKIWQEKWVLYMKTNIHFWPHLAQFFLEWEIFQTKFADRIETYMLCSIFFSPRKSCSLRDKMEKYGIAGQATHNTILRMRVACCRPKATNTHSGHLIRSFHCNSGCRNALKCYFIWTLTALSAHNFQKRYRHWVFYTQ